MKPNFPVPVDKPVKFAFNINEGKLTEKQSTKGTNFYEFVDFNEMPVKRAVYSFNFHMELNMKLTRERLLTYLDAMLSEIDNPEGSVTKLRKVIYSLQERTEMIYEPESIYKFASVVYFTESENPNDYSLKQGFQNIDIFKTVKDNTFFLSMPIKKCLPQPNLSDDDLLKCLEVAKKINQLELKNAQSMLSKKALTKESYSFLLSLSKQDSV